MLSSRMGPLFLGAGHDVAVQQPMWGKGPEVRFWAERGLVHWEYARDNSYGSMSISDACHRVLALSEMVTKSSEDGGYVDERRKLQQFICDMETVIKKAKEQGSPWAPDSAAEARRRRPVTAIMPTVCDLEF